MIYNIASGASWLWKKSPAFILGVQFLLGISLALSEQTVLACASLLLLIPLFFKPSQLRYAAISLLTFSMGFMYGSYNKIASFSEATEGWALFSPSSIKLQKNHFRTSYLFQGKIEYFSSDEGLSIYHLPCRLYVPDASDRPLANSSFFLKGTLQKIDRNGAEFVPNGPWKQVEGTFSFAELRFKAKKAFAKYVNKHIANQQAAHFLYALCTGEVEDRMMAHEFSKLGLQHILAVSGFHFALIALFIGFVMEKILPEKAALVALVIGLSIYFFFLGNSPSVLRAWLAISLWTTGRLMNKKTNGLNTLGVCLLIELLYDPHCIFHLGFQLSFLCSAAILLFVPITMKWTKVIFPKRTSQQVSQLFLIDRLAYLGCSFFRSSLAVTLAVHIASIPVCLHHFHSFPLLSLVYNLFFPLLTSLSLYGFMSAAFFSFLPIASGLIHLANSYFTSFLLSLSSAPPQLLQYSLTVTVLPFWAVVIYLTALLLFFTSWIAKNDQI